MNVIVKESTSKFWEADEFPGNSIANLRSIRLIDSAHNPIQVVLMGNSFGVEIIYEIKENGFRINPAVTVYSTSGNVILVSLPQSKKISTEVKIYKAICWFPANLFNNETYTLRINAHSYYPTQVHFDIVDAITFEVIEQNINDRKIDYKDKLFGSIRPDLSWEINETL
jgi:hypothetical protein